MIKCIYLWYVNYLVILQCINEKVLVEMSCHLKADSLLICWMLIAKYLQARVSSDFYSSQPIVGMAYMYFTVTKIYCSIKLPKLGLLVILNQEIKSGVYAR